MPDAGFHLDAVLARLTEVAYRLAAGLPLLLLAMLIVWLAWLFGSWLSRRAMFEHLVRSNAFLRDLARTTVRTIVVGLGVLAALELMDATALVGAVLGTAGVMGLALGFAFKETLENYLAGILMSLRQPFAPRDHL
ncbi:MAG: mechanosensitive ion channel, partial [Rhodoferax sp.]|nr:mechanosensitive ion channel [Rhodoferax sp.]